MSTAPSTRSESAKEDDPVRRTAPEQDERTTLENGAARASTVAAAWLDEVRTGEWDALVARHPLGTIYHLSAWKRAVEESFTHIRGRILGLRDLSSGDLVGGLPVYTVSSWLLGNNLVAAPFATYCDPLLRAPCDMRQLWSLLGTLHREIRNCRVHVKARSALPVADDLGFGQNTSHLHHYLPLEGGPEKLMKGFSRTNVRQWIQRAERAGLKVDRCRGEAGTAAFYPLFVNTRRRLGLPWVPYRFFDALNRSIGPEGLSCFMARNDEGLVAGVLTFHFKDTLILESLGDSEASHKSGAVQLIFWTAIQQACLEGYRFVSFGRTEKDNEGLASHKRCWGCVEETLTDYCYPRESASTPRGRMGDDAARRWMGTVLRKAPLPIGSALGRLLYRHWA